jgi:hypothetical protein
MSRSVSVGLAERDRPGAETRREFGGDGLKSLADLHVQVSALPWQTKKMGLVAIK